MQHEVYVVFPPNKRMEIYRKMSWDWSNKTEWIGVLHILGDKKWAAK